MLLLVGAFVTAAVGALVVAAVVGALEVARCVLSTVGRFVLLGPVPRWKHNARC